ncbi:hypothetical protein CAPTEDRAFT_186834 [Capitella teleta]|uniref:Uncharacterized protein n=1 Tax=Capitella teleta TaxID=283909 RepID=R7UC95_CAPTE|nr:hypothetical protein CAPTEDRAFT_186834 [Capitella teleta]|eukprot:ELU03980.1 hypothetical protein CAPTEDRAFT_186834 [Capitella teleta]
MKCIIFVTALLVASVSAKSLEERVLSLERKANNVECMNECLDANYACLDTCSSAPSRKRSSTECFHGVIGCVTNMMICVGSCPKDDEVTVPVKKEVKDDGDELKRSLESLIAQLKKRKHD